MKVEIDVLIRFPDGGGKLTHQTANAVCTAVRREIEAAEDDWNIRGIWVHEAPPKQPEE